MTRLRRQRARPTRAPDHGHPLSPGSGPRSPRSCASCPTRPPTRPCAGCCACSRTRASSPTSATVCATSICRSGTRRRRGQSALRHLVNTFFGGSGENAVAALLDLPETKLTPRPAPAPARHDPQGPVGGEVVMDAATILAATGRRRPAGDRACWPPRLRRLPRARAAARPRSRYLVLTLRAGRRRAAALARGWWCRSAGHADLAGAGRAPRRSPVTGGRRPVARRRRR